MYLFQGDDTADKNEKDEDVESKESYVVMEENETDQLKQQHLADQSTAEPSSVLLEEDDDTDERTAQAALLIFVKSVKNLTMLHRGSNNQTLDLHLDQLEQHFDYLMVQLMDLLQIGWHQTKAGWSKIAPVLVNALHIGWHQIRAGWTKIAPIVRKELALELDGNPSEWAEDAVKTWKRQEVHLRNHGKFIHSVVSDVRKRAAKEVRRLKKEEQHTSS